MADLSDLIESARTEATVAYQQWRQAHDRGDQDAALIAENRATADMHALALLLSPRVQEAIRRIVAEGEVTQ